MDADPFFSLLLEGDVVRPVYCHAHCRRKFQAIKKQAKKQGLAHEALRYYKKHYRVERDA
jgi:transposase